MILLLIRVLLVGLFSFGPLLDPTIEAVWQDWRTSWWFRTVFHETLFVPIVYAFYQLGFFCLDRFLSKLNGKPPPLRDSTVYGAEGFDSKALKKIVLSIFAYVAPLALLDSFIP
jgi:hypothetical protein